ncbi:hypothetical protein, partial [Tannerella sp.]|uniref:hypothetical protein n=1 Tax=Tannerella sp. TaxID=2382127 RepID=UPI0026DB8E96
SFAVAPETAFLRSNHLSQCRKRRFCDQIIYRDAKNNLQTDEKKEKTVKNKIYTLNTICYERNSRNQLAENE